MSGLNLWKLLIWSRSKWIFDQYLPSVLTRSAFGSFNLGRKMSKLLREGGWRCKDGGQSEGRVEWGGGRIMPPKVKSLCSLFFTILSNWNFLFCECKSFYGLLILRMFCYRPDLFEFLFLVTLFWFLVRIDLCKFWMYFQFWYFATFYLKCKIE